MPSVIAADDDDDDAPVDCYSGEGDMTVIILY